MVLTEFGPLSLRDLGGMIVCEAGSPSRVVDALVQRGLVGRQSDPRDRRAVLLDLTTTARELVPTLHAIERELDAATADRLDPAQRALLAGVLRELPGRHPRRPRARPQVRRMAVHTAAAPVLSRLPSPRAFRHPRPSGAARRRADHP